MAKNKKAPNKLKVYLNENNYFKSGKARNLPITKCLINTGWKSAGLASIIVVRQHVNQNVTLGLYMADLYCAGVKDTYFYFNISDDEFLDIIDKMSDNFDLAECDYNLAHNIIYGSAAFAADFGIPPHKDFSLTKMILEEDDDAIPLIDVEFGQGGIPFLAENSNDPKSKFYHSQLLKYAGEGNFQFISEEQLLELDEEYYPENWESADWEDFFEDLDGCETNNELMHELIDGYAATYYIFEKTLVAPTLETKKIAAENVTLTEMELVFEPLVLSDYEESVEELKDVEECHHALKNFQKSKSRSKSQGDKLIKMIQKAIAKWTKNPVFLNYLLSAYYLTNNINAAEETAKLTLKLFPSYLFGKIAFARLLIEKGALDKVPDLFNGEYNLKSVYPERNKFHVQEFLAFNSLWCHYFLKKGNLYMANLHYRMNYDMDVPEEFILEQDILVELHNEICNYVKDLIFGKNTQFTREELIKTLAN